VSRQSNGSVIELRDVSKWYGEVIGVNQLTASFGAGVTGILGPNGAGKSTLLNLITGRLRPSRGQVRVLGCNPWREPQVMRRVGYCPDTDSFYEDMNAEEFITLMGQLSGFPRDESLVRARERIELLQMSAFAHRRIREYSKGMRQRVKLAAALIHGPEVLILDEPLNGLDPPGRKLVLDLLGKLGTEGRTVLVSSHILHEIEALTDRILLIHRGRVLAEGRIEEIRFLIENQPLTYRIVSRERRRIAGELAKLESVMALTFAEPPEDALEVRTNRPAELFEVIQNGVVARQWSVEEVYAVDDNLDAVFQYLVKE